MANITSAIKDTISISMFNRGLAGKIFEEVKQSGAKVVMKKCRRVCSYATGRIPPPYG